MGRVPRLAVVLLSVLTLAVLGVSVALAQELGDSPAAVPPPPPAAVAPPPPEAPPQDANGPPPDTVVPVRWRTSSAVGLPYAGRLVRGVELPESGRDYFTWDAVLKSSPSRTWRRWGTDALIRTVLEVLAEYRAAHPDAPRVGIGDLSRPHGGVFDQRYGGLGHASHQNGLDADVYYPRRDGAERRPFKLSQVDLVLAQDLVDRFVAAGAQYVFVGPRLALTGPRRIVSKLAHHDDHLHVRLQKPRR
jgi:murein endopeptidase